MNGSGATLLPEKLKRAAKPFKLTAREWEVLCLVCSGEVWKSVAGKLGISPHTVDFHIRNILKKTGAHNCVAALTVLTYGKP